MAPSDPRQALKSQVRNALMHLYDPIHLRRHPLAWRLSGGRDSTPAAAGQALRQALLQAIESIRPEVAPEISEAMWRPYRIMQLRYVEAMAPIEVQRALGIAKTQYYCQHEQALEAVTYAFAAQLASGPREEPRRTGALPPAQEMPPETPSAHVYLVPLASLAEVKQALAAIQAPVGDERRVVFMVGRLWEPGQAETLSALA